MSLSSSTMHSFRIRYIVLGLLVYIQSAFCRICGTNFNDVPSSAYRASIVFHGTATTKSNVGESADSTDIQHVRFRVQRVFKGELPATSQRHFKFVGPFSQEENELRCISGPVTPGQDYIVFLSNQTTSLASNERRRRRKSSSLSYIISSFPVNYSKADLRLVRDITCNNCATLPRVKLSNKSRRNTTLLQGRRLSLQCRIKSGKPKPVIRWSKNNIPIRNDSRIKITHSERKSRLRIDSVQDADGGTYSCHGENVLGSSPADAIRIMVLPTDPSMHDRLCPEHLRNYCLNGGVCYTVPDLNAMRCQCPVTYNGKRCGFRVITNEVQEKTAMDRTLTITGLALGVIILGVICIVSYILAKNRRDKFRARRAERRREKMNNNSRKSLLGNSTDGDETIVHMNDIKSPPVDAMPKESAPAYPGNKSIPAPVSDRHVGNYGVGPQTLPFNSYSVPSDHLRPRLPGVSKTPNFDLKDMGWEVNAEVECSKNGHLMPPLPRGNGGQDEEEESSGSYTARNTLEDSHELTSESQSPTSSSDPSSPDEVVALFRKQIANPRVPPTPPTHRRDHMEMAMQCQMNGNKYNPQCTDATEPYMKDENGMPYDSDPEATVV